jgi:hypothetical protein
MANIEMIQEKIGEAIGLEKAAQKAVEELDSRGLLKPEQMKRLSKMRDEASKQEQEMHELVQDLNESDGSKLPRLKIKRRRQRTRLQRLWKLIWVKTLIHKKP